MRRPFVHGQRRRLAIVLSAVVTHVGLGVRVHNVVLVETRVLRETFAAAVDGAYIGFLTWRQNKVKIS